MADNYCIIAINIIAIVISPVIATVIANRNSNKSERRREKIKILQTLMMTRLNRRCLEYVNALNLIDVVFYDSDNVRKAYKNLLEMYRAGSEDGNEHNIKNLKLIESIVDDLGYNKEIRWDEISMPYNPVWFYNELEKQEKMKDAQVAFMDVLQHVTSTEKK